MSATDLRGNPEITRAKWIASLLKAYLLTRGISLHQRRILSVAAGIPIRNRKLAIGNLADPVASLSGPD